MATNKKSFQLYTDQGDYFEALTDEQAGKLIKIIFEYVNGKDEDPDPKIEDPLLKMAFLPIKKTLKRDLIKWRERCNINKVNSAKGGEAMRKKKAEKSRTAIKKAEGGPKKPDNDIDTDTVKDNDINNIKNNIKKSKVWLDQICMKKRIEEKEIKKHLETFLDDQELKGELDRPLKDIKKHFVSWLNIQLKKEIKPTKNKPYRNI